MPKRFTLEQVKTKAIKDLRFFKALVADSTTALDDAKISLDPTDMDILNMLLKVGTVPINAKEFLACVGEKTDTGSKGAWA